MTVQDDAHLVDSAYAWMRLAATLAIGAISGVAMWSIVVALPAVQQDFGIDRALASLPYTVLMAGFASGSFFMGRLADRYGVGLVIGGGSLFLGAGYAAAALSRNIWEFTLAEGLLVGFLGSSATFGPLMADTSFWFRRRRGLAVAICASGNYLAGTVWPPIVEHYIGAWGWRPTHLAIAAFCVATMLPLAWFLRRRPPIPRGAARAPGGGEVLVLVLGLRPGVVTAMLMVAGVACCVAMATPQVHIVAYCGDLGYGTAAGAQMVSLMLGFGIVSRLASGFVADRIGGMRTLLLSSALQGLALVLYSLFTSLPSLYVISALFGLFQGGLIPSYAIVIREIFPAREVASRLGMVLTGTMAGMSLGGWLAGFIFDQTGTYGPAFMVGTVWNLLNLSLCYALYRRRGTLRAAFA